MISPDMLDLEIIDFYGKPGGDPGAMAALVARIPGVFDVYCGAENCYFSVRATTYGFGAIDIEFLLSPWTRQGILAGVDILTR